MKQNDAVFQAVCQVLGQTNFDQAVVLTTDQRKQVIEIVSKGICEKKVDFSTEASEKYNTFDKVKTYTSGMVSNHLRKDKRLNCNTKYEAKNPGSRTGQGDEMLKNLKALRSQLTDLQHIQAVDEKIAERTNELSKKTVTIDIDKLPEELRHLVKAS